MFRVKQSEEGGHALAETVVQAMLLFALLANFGSSYLLLAEYRHLGSALTSGEPAAVAEVGPLRQWVGWQMVLNLALSLVLAACVASIWWLRRRYMDSQNSLRQVKMLAHDILASMGDGVVTADREGTITNHKHQHFGDPAPGGGFRLCRPAPRFRLKARNAAC
jgi:hypothetical protein